MALTQSKYPILQFLSDYNRCSRSVAQYKYQFGKKWRWKKNIPASKKAAILELGQQRAALGKESAPRFKGKDVDFRKLRRHMKHVFRHELVAQGAMQRLHPRRGLFSVIIPFQNRMYIAMPILTSPNSPLTRSLDFSLGGLRSALGPP
jgi:hypothetical protein